MAHTQRHFSKAEFARRGDATYESAVRPNLNANDDGKFIAIDIETGEYELDTEKLRACDRLRTRLPNAQIWMMRVGSRYVDRLRRKALPGLVAPRRLDK